ncbi:uncharacterized protein LOC115007442 [Cottoperca gobio]|uniref:Uncharacterized protein LOC115007442 n=1 Tax=Cottoperca gobio TaxID=56716 RepID=A0A6J2PKJ8_COTGO|nr:uncharacterized protein LOC115007442 [Cottoperca gobio]
MMRLCWFTLLLCVSANAGNDAMWRESGENVTLRCSSAGCPSGKKKYDGMYLYLNQYHAKQKQVLYYHPCQHSTDKITPGVTFLNRIQTNGSLESNTITISQLTVNDSGFYSCVFQIFPDEVQCSVHTLFIRGVAPCSISAQVPCALTSEKSPPLVVIIIAACIISTLVTMIFVLLILPRVKQRICRRRSVQQVSNDYVYEVMTKSGLRPAQERSLSSPYDLD